LRFYSDGIVISCSSTGEAEDLKKWFDKDHPNIGRGNYYKNNNNIYFKIELENGTIIYDGVIISDHEIILNTKSMINEHEGISKYYFVKF
jgi:hypothetical protein